MVNKIHIYADVVSFVRLLLNSKIREGKDIKCMLRTRAEIHLCISKKDLSSLWEDEESILRKLCDAIDLPCPQADPSLLQIYEFPNIVQQDPLGIWFFNLTEENISRFQEYYGVWMLNAESIDDETLFLHHNREYDIDDVIEGESDNGWKNYLNQLDKALPPLNSIVINDRYLINNTNESSAAKYGFWGLNNLLKLLDAILPSTLGIPFHLLIYCQHPKLPIVNTNEIINQFIANVKDLRGYEIVVEFVYNNQSRHKRTFHSNYFLLNIDRGYNAFYNYNWKNYVEKMISHWNHT